MQLVAFRIQNFRSIVDTGWHQLAHDNITSLIGQNESGKTSILEGLKAFPRWKADRRYASKRPFTAHGHLSLFTSNWMKLKTGLIKKG